MHTCSFTKSLTEGDMKPINYVQKKVENLPLLPSEANPMIQRMTNLQRSTNGIEQTMPVSGWKDLLEQAQCSQT
jgi:hypothetical protein